MSRTWLPGSLSSLALGALVFLSAQPAQAQDGIGRFNAVDGSVTVRGSAGAQTAVVNSPLEASDFVSTGDRSRADIVLAGGQALRLAGGVQMHVIGANQVQLADGTIEVAVLQSGSGSVQIDTPSVTVRVSEKGSYRISIAAGGATQITARTGSVDVVTPQQTYTVAAGKSLLASGSAANPSVHDVTAVAYDSFDDYNTARDRAYVAYDPSYGYGGTPGYGITSPWYYPPVVATACPAIGITIGWPWWGGFWSSCSYYPVAVAYSPWAWGWGWNPWYWNSWGSPYYAYGYYPYYNGYYPYYPVCCGRPFPYRPIPVVVPRAPVVIAHAPVIVPVAPIEHRVTAPVVAGPVATHPIVAMTHPVAHTIVAAKAPHQQVFKTMTADPWQRFDTARGTHNADVAKTPVVAGKAPADPHAPVEMRGDPRTTAASGDPWNRFTATRGDISVRPEPIEASQLHDVFGGGYERAGGFPSDPGHGSSTTGSMHGAPVEAHSSGGSSSGGSSGGAHSGGGGHPPK